MKDVRKDIKKIRSDIEKLFFHLPDKSTVFSKSPVHLTDFGKEISATVNATEWAEEHAPGLVNEARGKPEFEVFDICVRHVTSKFENDMEFNAVVRRGAYEHGTSPQAVMKVYHVELRDAVLRLDINSSLDRRKDGEA